MQLCPLFYLLWALNSATWALRSHSYHGAGANKVLQLVYDCKDGNSFLYTSAQMAGKLDGDSLGVLRRNSLSAGHSYGTRGAKFNRKYFTKFTQQLNLIVK